ncbi:MAG: DUF1080 domain-containing protein [Saprospiraceae bacterium]|nr:DUF1080 domain-containing protein [Saprospiraceae bacterium]
MKKQGFAFTMAALLLALAFSTKTSAQDGWVELINGKDMTGWRPNEHTSTWTVQDGLLTGVGKRSHLFYEGEHLRDGFKNFEMEVQVRTFKLANSGIYFHTNFQDEGWPGTGIEIQVNNSHIGEGTYIELKKMGSLYGYRNIFKTFSKDDEWMTVKARVESDRVQVWVNGLQTVDYRQPARTFSRLRRLSKGTFCLQGHDDHSRMQYRSFRVRRLPDDASSGLIAPDFGVWHDTLMAMQGRNFPFIDLNPPASLTALELTDYVRATGINAALVKSPKMANQLGAASGLPLFTGIKVTAKGLAKLNKAMGDFVIGESTDLKSAKALLGSGKIQVWSDMGRVLNAQTAGELLDIAKQKNVAIVIDNETQHPSLEVLKMAKAKGCKFTMSGLVPKERMEQSSYVFEVLKSAGLDYRDFYVPGM